MTVHDALQIATAHHREGRLAEAEAIYRSVLAEHPDVPEALNLLGVLEHQRGRNEEAVRLLERAVALSPHAALCHFHLGAALSALGETERAIEAARRSVACDPSLAEAHYNLGLWLQAAGHLDAALQSLAQALRLRPTYAEAHCATGNVLTAREQIPEAITAYAQALRHRPDYAEAHYNLANLLLRSGQPVAACDSYRTALRLRPDFADAYFNLGNCLHQLGDLDGAASAYDAALRAQPHYAGALWHRGNVWKDRGRIREAITDWRHALAIEPGDAALHSTLVLYLRYDPATPPAAVAAEEALWNERHAVPLRPRRRSHAVDRSPDRPLRIGYVSPDFWNHAVGRNVLPLFTAHDRTQYSIHCYSQSTRHDALTERLRDCADRWSDTARVTDDELDEQIRADGIDILVDLSLHTGGNRLLVFAREPAPVQFSFAGYPGGTGVETIGHRISDAYLEAGETCTETVHLIDSFWCYDPIDVVIPVNPLPALQDGVLTFGCLNQPCKINERVLALWARVLEACAGSRLLLLSPAGSHRAAVTETLRGSGIASERVEFASPGPRTEYMQLYHRVDAMLDTRPYNGHTTSLEALWMGVPVITLPGDAPVARAGLSQLMNLGLPELIARTPDDYLRIAAELCADLPRLAKLRESLRSRMENSVIMDASRFARSIESAYRRAWRSWCAK